MTDQDSQKLADLGHKLNQGDHAGFSEIFDYFSDKIYRYIVLKVKTSDAEDLVELTFIKLWENRAKFDADKGNLQTWLFTIARNVVIDYYRAYKETFELNEEVDNQHISQHNPKADAQDEFEEQQLQELLSRLSDQHREIIILRYVEELSYKEIGEITDKSEGAVRVLQMRALNQLKKLTKKSGFKFQ